MSKAHHHTPEDASAEQTSPKPARTSPIPFVSHVLHPRLPGRRDPYLLAAVLFAAYGTVSITRYLHLNTRSWDLGIFEQAVRAYAHFQAPIVDLKGPGANVLGDHFSPIIALLAPLYRLFPSPLTLLIAQAALFALSAVPVTRAAAVLLGRRRGLALGLAYGLSWGVQRAVDFDFHEICFAVPLIAFSMEALLARRWHQALLWSLPLILVKEDLGLTVAAIALIVAVRSHPESTRTAGYAVGVAAVAVATTLVIILVVIPAFNTVGDYDYWSKVGSGSSPFDGADIKLRTLAWLLIPTSGLLALRSPLFAVALPTLGWRFLSVDDHYWGTDWHYSAVLMPTVFLALTDALSNAQRSPRPWLRSYAHYLPTAVASAALALTTALPLSALTEPATYQIPADVTAVERLLGRIPDGASVESDIGPISRLTSRCRVFWIGNTRGITPDYIAFDNSTGWVPDIQLYIQQLHPDVHYSVIGATHGYIVLHRNP